MLDGFGDISVDEDLVVLTEYERLCKQRFGGDEAKLQLLKSNYD